MTSEPFRRNREAFDAPDVVADYLTLQGLTADEEVLFRRHVAPGARVLDLGVGTGRTTGPLASMAAQYVGVDYAPRMVAAARARHPGLDLRVLSVTDLSAFRPGSFDVVVFSYNGIDYLHPDRARRAALAEVRRVLVPTGTFLLSSHNPRALLAGPPRWSGPRGFAVAGVAAARRTRRLVTARAFWSGAGYVHEPYRGGLVHHMATPARVRAELAGCGFRHLETLGCRATRATAAAWTPWYTYAFAAGGPAG